MTHLSCGRWDFARQNLPGTVEEQVDQALKKAGILCRETAKDLVSNHLLCSWKDAMDVLCIREYVGKVKRGYFVQKLSGIQYIAEEHYQRVKDTLTHPRGECKWLCAIDPAQPWGKIAPHIPERSFMNIASTYVAMYSGRVVAVSEQKGKILRIFEEDLMEELIKNFIREFSNAKIYRKSKRLVISDYPAAAVEFFIRFGMHREIKDYVIYR